MAVEKITIDDFFLLSKTSPVLDVRSPGEYIHAHIPGAYSLPLFTDEERKVVGTTYKQVSRENAIKVGLKYFGTKTVTMIEEVEQLVGETANPLIIHCWRGGMRSAAVAWLLDLYGFKVYTLIGGYKVFRKWVLQQFEKEYDLKIIGGYTGSGKTNVLKSLQQQGETIIDLEALANHKGSAFGSLGEQQQPSQEMFENLLALELWTKVGSCLMTGDSKKDRASVIWLEDESQRIGNVNIPLLLFEHMRTKPVLFLDIPFEERLNNIIEAYGNFEREKLVNAIMRIKKRLGGLETKTALNFLLDDDIKNSFAVLLKYYDKWYLKGLHNRNNLHLLLNKIECPFVDVNANAEIVLQSHEQNKLMISL